MREDKRSIDVRRTWGFRFSVFDAIILGVTAVGTPWLVRKIGAVGWIPAFVVLHFFLFCNVFRIRRVPELVWGAVLCATRRLIDSRPSLSSCHADALSAAGDGDSDRSRDPTPELSWRVRWSLES